MFPRNTLIVKEFKRGKMIFFNTKREYIYKWKEIERVDGQSPIGEFTNMDKFLIADYYEKNKNKTGIIDLNVKI